VKPGLGVWAPFEEACAAASATAQSRITVSRKAAPRHVFHALASDSPHSHGRYFAGPGAGSMLWKQHPGNCAQRRQRGRRCSASKWRRYQRGRGGRHRRDHRRNDRYGRKQPTFRRLYHRRWHHWLRRPSEQRRLYHRRRIYRRRWLHRNRRQQSLRGNHSSGWDRDVRRNHSRGRHHGQRGNSRGRHGCGRKNRRKYRYRREHRRIKAHGWNQRHGWNRRHGWRFWRYHSRWRDRRSGGRRELPLRQLG
jgi:hypothetical protein